MQLRDIQYVLSVSKLGSFTEAASACFVSEPALSQAISKLESQLGTKLFLRGNGRHLTLTDAGKVFVGEGENVLDAMSALKEKMEACIGNRGKHLRLAIAPYYEKCYLSNVLASFQQSHPSVTFSIIEAMSDEGERLLVMGDVDLAFVISPRKDKSIKCKCVFDDDLVLIMPRTRVFMANMPQEDRPCSMDDFRKLSSVPFIVPKQGRRLRESVMAICKSAGFRPICSIETESSSNIYELVKSGCGVGIVPSGIIKGSNCSDIFYYALKTPLSRRQLSVAYNERASSDLALNFALYAVSMR
ncbi:LysR family transcriptional regulator [Thermophilibacter immobilis]|uniref:LysR family transcriptional regulator n=1 Tax=Thermophilibacter immobilis TaxID=2779519 RepID=A0A7S7M7S5_9ACTN|nr:LysR family transcriptional regulator [Thermophilibacter immobilis]QOY60339.1 LysR family transcriptional regulator [Thermophilibacter immobilis]